TAEEAEGLQWRRGGKGSRHHAVIALDNGERLVLINSDQEDAAAHAALGQLPLQDAQRGQKRICGGFFQTGGNSFCEQRQGEAALRVAAPVSPGEDAHPAEGARGNGNLPPLGIRRQLAPQPAALAKQKVPASRVLPRVLQVGVEDKGGKLFAYFVEIRMVKLIPEEFGDDFVFRR